MSNIEKVMGGRKATIAVNVFVVFSLLVSIFAYVGQRNLSSCVANWANRYTAVANVRSDANQVRVNTLHKLLLDAVDSPSQRETAKDQINLMDALAKDPTDSVSIQAAATKYAADIRANASNAVLLADVENFINTERDYQDAVKDHPLPSPPKEVCS